MPNLKPSLKPKGKGYSANPAIPSSSKHYKGHKIPNMGHSSSAPYTQQIQDIPLMDLQQHICSDNDDEVKDNDHSNETTKDEQYPYYDHEIDVDDEDSQNGPNYHHSHKKTKPRRKSTSGKKAYTAMDQVYHSYSVFLFCFHCT